MNIFVCKQNIMIVHTKLCDTVLRGADTKL